jgi:hypothetical protein
MTIGKPIIDHIRGLLAVCKSSLTAGDDNYIITINLRENDCGILFRSRPDEQILNGCEISKSECEYGGKKEWSCKAKFAEDITVSWFEEAEENETL